MDKILLLLPFILFFSGCSSICQWEQAWEQDSIVIYWVNHCDKSLILLKPDKTLLNNPDMIKKTEWVITEHRDKNNSEGGYRYYVLEPAFDEDYRERRYKYSELPDEIQNRDDWR